MEILKATLWDIFEIANMWKDMREEVTGEKEDNKESFVLGLITQLYQSSYVVLVAREKEAITGFILNHISYLDYEREITGSCNYLFVKKEFRNHKIDEELISRSIEELKKNGVKKIEFTTTQRLAKFWERKGYRASKVVMRKEI